MKLITAGVLVGLASAGAARAENERPHIEVERVVEHARVLTEDIGPRPVNSEAAGRAADYITAQVEAAGLVVDRQEVGMVVAAEIFVGSRRVAPKSEIHVGDFNLVTRIPSSDAGPPILLMAHYDSVSTTPGAIDNAVSVGLLVELARALVDAPPPRPVIVAWPAAEETRLAGATRLAEELGAELGLAVAIDIVGSPGDVTLNGLSTMIGRDWLEWLAAIARRADVGVSAPWPHRIISRWWPQIERSDHGAFTARQVPALHIYTRDPARLDLAYHSAHDTVARVDHGAVAEVASFLVTLVMTEGPLPTRGGDAGMWLPLPGGPYVVATTTMVAVELLLAAIAVITLAGLVRRWRAAPRRRGGSA